MMNNFQQQEMTRYMDRPSVRRRDKDGLISAQEKEEQGEHGGEQGVQMLIGAKESLSKMTWGPN